MENKITKIPQYIQVLRSVTVGFIMYLLFSLTRSLYIVFLVNDIPIDYLTGYLLIILLYFFLAAITLFIFQIKLKPGKRNVFFWLHLSFSWLIFGKYIIYIFINLFSPWGDNLSLTPSNYIISIPNLIFLLIWILLYFFMNKYSYHKDIKETIELPRKDRSSFYALLIFATVIIVWFVFWAFSSSGDCGQSPGCAVAMGMFFLIVLGYILVIDIFIIVGFEGNKLKKKSFWVSLILAVIIPPMLFGGIILMDELRSKSFDKMKSKSMENQAIASKYVSEGDVNGCINYMLANKVEYDHLYNAEDVEQFCEQILGYQEFKLIGDTKNISLCTTDFCFYNYALAWDDILACNKINETTLKDKCKELYLK